MKIKKRNLLQLVVEVEANRRLPATIISQRVLLLLTPCPGLDSQILFPVYMITVGGIVFLLLKVRIWNQSEQAPLLTRDILGRVNPASLTISAV